MYYYFSGFQSYLIFSFSVFCTYVLVYIASFVFSIISIVYINVNVFSFFIQPFLVKNNASFCSRSVNYLFPYFRNLIPLLSHSNSNGLLV